jgi:large subunit ribosomal protein L24
MSARKNKPGVLVLKRPTSKHPRKQRKYMFNAPKHQKRKSLSSHLSEELLLKYNVRSVPVIKGDYVKVMRGSLKGHTGKVAKVNMKKGMINVEGATIAKADGTQLAKWMDPSNVLITKLDLSDPWRRRKLGALSEEAVEIEEEPEEKKVSKPKTATAKKSTPSVKKVTKK